MHNTGTRAESTKVAIITGGSSGIGLATAIRFVQGGYRIAISGRNIEKLERSATAIRQAVSGAQCLAAAVDLSDAHEAASFVERAHEHYGNIDVLVNAAGSARLGAVTELDPAAFDDLLRNNLNATFSCCRAAIPYLRARRNGVIVNLSSRAAIDPFPGFAVYGACKAWIELFTQALASELADDSIAVFSVRPGAVETPMLRASFPSFPSEKALSPATVAEVIWQLTGNAWRNSSGTAIPVQQSSSGLRPETSPINSPAVARDSVPRLPP